MAEPEEQVQMDMMAREVPAELKMNKPIFINPPLWVREGELEQEVALLGILAGMADPAEAQ